MKQIRVLGERMKEKFRLEKERVTRDEMRDGAIRAGIYAGCYGYLELVFHLWIYHKAGWNLWNGVLESIVFGMVMAVFTGMFRPFINRWLGRIMLYVVSIYYIVQAVYHHVFLRFLCLYSVGAVGTDALEFVGEIKKAVIECLGIILLLLVPAVVHTFVLRKYLFLHSASNGIGILGILGLSAVLLQLIFVGGLRLQGNETYSAYDLYHHWVQDMGTEKLGLIQTVVKDLQGLTGTASEDVIELPVYAEQTVDAAKTVPSAAEPQGVEGTKEKSSPSPKVTNSPKPESTEQGVPEKGTPEPTEKASPEPTGEAATEPTLQATPEPSKAEEPEETEDPVYNQIPLVFESKGKKKSIEALNQYFSMIQPTKKNEYTGKFKGYNLIWLTAEGFSPWAVNEKTTPTLYRLTQEGFVFKNFYTPLWWCSTSDGEYAACQSLIPKAGVTSMYVSGSNYLPFTMGNQLQRYGYDCHAYHDHSYTYYHRDVSHPNMGYVYKGIGNGLEMKKQWPESDLEMMEKTIPEYVNEDKFHVYYMTVSGHMNYSFQGNMMSHKNRDAVKDLPYSDDAKAYMACNVELDRALEYLIQQLTEAGVAEKTVIALSADHYPYGLEKSVIDELAGHKVEENFELYQNHFILWNPTIQEPIVVEKPCCSLDILPTLSNLFGVEYDSRLMVGHDIFSDSEPLVIFSNRSFITDRIMYNSTNGKVTYLTKEKLPEHYLEEKIKQVKNQFTISKSILENDYYRQFEELLQQYWSEK